MLEPGAFRDRHIKSQPWRVVCSMPDSIDAIARALITADGTGTSIFAEQALRGARALAMDDKVAEWERVIEIGRAHV